MSLSVKDSKAKSMKKKQKRPPMNPDRVARHLEAAREALRRAILEDMALDKFSITFEDGHKLTLEKLHTWLIAAGKHYEENGPKEAALRTVQELLQTQYPARQ